MSNRFLPEILWRFISLNCSDLVMFSFSKKKEKSDTPPIPPPRAGLSAVEKELKSAPPPLPPKPAKPAALSPEEMQHLEETKRKLGLFGRKKKTQQTVDEKPTAESEGSSGSLNYAGRDSVDNLGVPPRRPPRAFRYSNGYQQGKTGNGHPSLTPTDSEGLFQFIFNL